MDKWEFLKWRRTLGYTQDEVGEKLGVSRGTIQHWERGVTRIPRAMEMASQELTRRWKQRPDFGPVSLVYAGGRASHSSFLHCELHVNSDAAIQEALRLYGTPNFINPHIMEDGGGVVWTTPELLGECARRRRETEIERETPEEARSGKEQSAPLRRPAKRDRPSDSETG